MKRVLFITNKSDHAVNSITAWLDRLDQSYLRINTEEYLNAKNIITIDNLSNELSFFFNGEKITSENLISACYRRPMLSFLTPHENSEYLEAQWKHSFWSVVTCLKTSWINHPLWGKSLLEHNKFYQLKLAASVGLDIPQTLISNDHQKIVRFIRKCNGKAACKPLRHTNLADKDNVPVGIYTQLVTEANLNNKESEIAVCPMIVQEYIEKSIELRLTVIGHHIFACEIHSQNSERTKHDWRKYDFENVKHQPHCLPPEIEVKILVLMEKLRLNYGAMDMILTPNGKYVFLEVNPTGQYGWIEDITGLAISETFAHCLMNPSQNGIRTYSVDND